MWKAFWFLIVALTLGAAAFAAADDVAPDGLAVTVSPVSVAVTVSPISPVTIAPVTISPVMIAPVTISPVTVTEAVIVPAPAPRVPIVPVRENEVVRRTTLTDLPPAIVSGEVDRMEILADSAPVGEVILRICKGYRADCAVVISGSGIKLAWTCSGDPMHCWRTFLAALSQLGVNVRVLPGVDGAAYAFSLSGGLAVDPASVAPENQPPRR